jgi:RNA polymerase sigma-70 factor, ECF subfamily
MLDDDLVRAAMGGDRDAFGQLVERHRTSALRIAYAIADGEAEDVTQEAATKAMRRLSTVQADRPFRPWYLAIVANEARNRRRSFMRRSALVLRVSNETSARVAETDEVALRNERRKVLLDAVAKLRTEDREVLSMRYFAELSEAEMASALGVAPGTVKSRLSRALSRLRTELGEVDE